MKGIRTRIQTRIPISTHWQVWPTTRALRTTHRIAHQLPSPGRTRTRGLSTSLPLRQAQVQPQPQPPPEKPVNFYQTHGRAVFKALTLAFLSYQIVYWTWLTLETEEIKDQKNREIETLEREVRLLDESRRAQKSGG